MSDKAEKSYMLRDKQKLGGRNMSHRMKPD
jgi:hypothetical protein